MKSLSFLILFVILAYSVAAQQPPVIKPSIAEIVNGAISRQKLAGVAVGVYQEGKPKYMKGFGFANLELRVYVNENTIFQLASVGKQFTAACVLILEQDGKLSVDDKVSKYLEDTPVEWKDMTIRHLLTHTSGLGDYPPTFDYRKDYTESRLFEIIKKQKLQFKPGEKFQYSNFGYVTLGVLIRKVSGKYYGDFLKERIFMPLQMTTARVISEKQIVLNRAAGYTLSDGKIVNQSWVSPSLNTTADGALYMTLKDMAKWDAGLRQGKILSPASLKKAWTPVKLNDGKSFDYGFGWTIGRVTGSRVVEHSGSWQGFKSHIARYLDRDTTIVVFSNSSQANTREILQDIAERVDSRLARIRDKAISDPTPELTNVAKEIVVGRVAGKVDRKLFSADKGQKAFDIMSKYYGWMSSFGRLLKIDLNEASSEKEIRKRKFRMYFDDAEVVAYFSFDASGKVTGFAFQ